MMVDPNMFKKALGRFASGVTVLTVHDSGSDHGMTASAFTSLSLDPPLVLVCIRKGNRCYEMIENAGTFVVNILAQDQDTFSNRFAGGLIDSDGEWKAWPEGQSTFDDLEITRGKHSTAPLLPGCLAHLECGLETVHSGGDHGIFIGRVVAIHVNDETSDPLLYFAGQYGRLQDS